MDPRIYIHRLSNTNFKLSVPKNQIINTSMCVIRDNTYSPYFFFYNSIICLDFLVLLPTYIKAHQGQLRLIPFVGYQSPSSNMVLNRAVLLDSHWSIFVWNKAQWQSLFLLRRYPKLLDLFHNSFFDLLGS